MLCVNRIALVTGASRGIGRAIAIRLAVNRAHVLINFLQDIEAAEETLRLIQSAGGSGELLPFDVSDPEQVQNALKNQNIDILVNNAGISRDALLLRAKETDWRKTLDTNLSGAFYCAKACSRHMIKQHWGRILNITSMVAATGNAGQVAYSSSKAGLIGLTKTLALELASRHITVNAIAPGYIKTEMTAQLELERSIPVGYAGEPEDIAHAALFLVAEEARYITGHTLHVNGGLGMS